MKKSFYRHSWFLVSLCLVIFASVVSSCEAPATPAGNTGTTKSSTVKETPQVIPEPPASNETMGQKNAVATAKGYLNSMSFSKTGLIGQLEYEGYSTADATYAVTVLDVDWRAQAVLTAKGYLKSMSFSRSGLIEQLEYEGFSNADATYAVGQVGY